MIAFHTLGAVDLRRGELSLSTVLAQPKRLALLAYLTSARPRGFHSRDTLLALFWPEADGERARNSLRQALHQLRRALGESVLPGRGEQVGVDWAQLRCDAADFDDAIEGGCWEDALSLYRGDFLPGVFVQDAPEAERWLEDERARRRRDAMSAAWRLADAADASGDLAAAVQWARRAVALEPGDEAAHRRLLLLLDRAGDTAGALAAHDDFARRLEQDYGMAPSAETTQLAERLRTRTSGLGARPSGLGTASGRITPPEAVPSADGRAPSPDARRRGVPLLAATVLLAVLAVGGWFGLRGRSAGDAGAVPAPSIAVLPFVNMSGEPANEYLSDGMTEELLNLLAQVPGLQVAARTSAFSFKGRNVPVDSIGRALRVRHVLEGSVRQSGARVRITAQLIDASTGYHLWSGSFDRVAEDLIAVQDSIGRAIVRTLRPRLASGAVASMAERREPRDPEAHVSVMKGWQAFRRNSREAYLAAAAHFQDAIRRDPEYGPGHAGLATIRHWQANFRQIDPDSGYAEARALAGRALALDSSLADGYMVLGRIAERVDRDYPAALAHFARAIAVAPSDARPYGRRAVLLARMGRSEEALASARRAVELDPASPAVYADLAGLYGEVNRFAQAESAWRKALTLDPGHPILLGGLAVELAHQGKLEEALGYIVQARRKVPDDVNTMGQQAYVLARLKRGAEARALLDTALAAGMSQYNAANIYATLGDRERAIAMLERSVRDRDDGAVALLDSTGIPSVWHDPRVQKLVAELRGRQSRSGTERR
ncbi:MAG TPA: BTAD domain-containing putative transcriptional regulator [Gemmatimonadaceae bacterium]|nr:BTAD domain-containing putative transcriptional regulator [Gemmatimonadaceae bacterium]